jgi:hypothetical protein
MTDTAFERAQEALRSFIVQATPDSTDVGQAFVFNALLDRLSRDTGADFSDFTLLKSHLCLYQGEYMIRSGQLAQRVEQAIDHLDRLATMQGNCASSIVRADSESRHRPPD